MRKPKAPGSIPEVGEGKRGESGYLGYLLRQAANAQRRRMDQALAVIELTHPQFVVLTMIRAYPGCSNADLARLALLTPQTVHGIVAILERRALIVRRADPTHGRIQTIELTADGVALLKRAHTKVAAVEAELRSAMEKGEATIIRRWLVAVAKIGQGSVQSCKRPR